MAAVAKWLNGKKTYIVAAVMLVGLAVLLGMGKLTPELAFEVLVFAAPCFAATYRDALQTHHNQVMDVLLDTVDAGVALRAHNYAALEGVAAKTAGDCAGLYAAITPVNATEQPSAVAGVSHGGA